MMFIRRVNKNKRSSNTVELRVDTPKGYRNFFMTPFLAIMMIEMGLALRKLTRNDPRSALIIEYGVEVTTDPTIARVLAQVIKTPLFDGRH